MTNSSHVIDFAAKTIIIGDEGIGKSALMVRYCDILFRSDYECTLGKYHDFCSFLLTFRR